MIVKYRIIDEQTLFWDGKYYREGIGEVSEEFLDKERFDRLHSEHWKNLVRYFRIENGYTEK